MKPIHKSLLSSELAWIMLFLLALSALALSIPARALDASDGVSPSLRILVTKLSSFLPSAEQPDIVVLGSSLVLTPALRCDERLAGKPPAVDNWLFDHRLLEYTKSTYLAALLKQKTGQKLTIKNLGVVSSIMSDHYAIFEMMLAEKKIPRLIIVGVAPRDFLDNTQQKHLETPVRQFMNDYNEPALLAQNWKNKSMPEISQRIEHRFEKVFSQLRHESSALACHLTGHPERLESVTTQAHAASKENQLKDLETYRKLYNPPNFEMLTMQAEYLRKLLLDGQANGIAVLVVNMPLTKENTEVLDAAALLAYEKTLTKVCRDCHTNLLNIGSSSADYSRKDFEDCCHLNASGGNKFYDSVASTLSMDGNILASLTRKRVESK